VKPGTDLEAVESLARETTRVFAVAAGRTFNQAIAADLRHTTTCCSDGHYEGFDERVREQLADDELSIRRLCADNGALPVMVTIASRAFRLPSARAREALTSIVHHHRKRAVVST